MTNMETKKGNKEAKGEGRPGFPFLLEFLF
jgi:hypothetical protein